MSIIVAQNQSKIGLFVAVATGMAENLIMTSPDGINWTQQTIAETESWKDICYAPELGLLLALGTYKYAISEDGVNWTAYTLPIASAGAVGWSGELGKFVMATSSSGGATALSSDGVSWDTYAGNVTVTPLRIIWNHDYSLFVLSGGTGFETSADGITWTTRSVSGSWTDVVWANSLSLFVSPASGDLVTSPTTASWTHRTVTTGYWAGIAWSSELGILVIVGQPVGGVGGKCMYSTNGTSWTTATSINGYDWNSVVWSQELSLFVAVGASTSYYMVATSPDGINWTMRTAAAAAAWSRLVWAY